VFARCVLILVNIGIDREIGQLLEIGQLAALPAGSGGHATRNMNRRSTSISVSPMPCHAYLQLELLREEHLSLLLKSKSSFQFEVGSYLFKACSATPSHTPLRVFGFATGLVRAERGHCPRGV
jgi:hypothetical protein